MYPGLIPFMVIGAVLLFVCSGMFAIQMTDKVIPWLRSRFSRVPVIGYRFFCDVCQRSVTQSTRPLEVKKIWTGLSYNQPICNNCTAENMQVDLNLLPSYTAEFSMDLMKHWMAEQKNREELVRWLEMEDQFLSQLCP